MRPETELVITRNKLLLAETRLKAARNRRDDLIRELRRTTDMTRAEIGSLAGVSVSFVAAVCSSRDMAS